MSIVLALAYSNAESTAYTLRTGVPMHFTCTKNPTKQSLLQHMQVIAESDVDAVYYYNYGLLNKRRLSWIKEANAYINQFK